MGTVVVKTDEVAFCSLCGELAWYDAKTFDGRWAWLCERHFRLMTPGRLGTGIGQRIVYHEEVE